MHNETWQYLMQIFVYEVVMFSGYRLEIMRVVRYRIKKSDRKRLKNNRTFGNWLTLSQFYDAVPLVFFIAYYLQCLLFFAAIFICVVANFQYSLETSTDIMNNVKSYFILSTCIPFALYRLFFVGIGHSTLIKPRWME